MLKGSAYQTETSKLLAMGFGIILVLLLALSWLSLSTIQAYNTRMAELINNVTVKSAAASQMRELVIQRAAAYRTLPGITEDYARAQAYENIQQLTSDYETQRKRLEGLVTESRETNILDTIRNAEIAALEIQSRLTSYAPAEASTDNSEPLHTIALSRDTVLKNKLDELVVLERTVAKEQLQKNHKAYQQTRQFFTAMALLAIIIGALTVTIVTRRLRDINLQITHLALHDDLTGLINRREFKTQLQYLLQTNTRSTRSWGLMYIDLDRFKIVNDTCGHHAGDRLLKDLTALIKASIRSQDILARIGGDEFALLASAKDFDSIIALAESLRQKVSQYVFNYANQQFTVSLSIGLIPINGQAQDLEQVLTTVDSACYVAKQSGRDRVHVARSGDADVIKYRSDLAGIQLIRKALTEENLELFYQPVYAIEEHGLTLEHCEVLLRIRTEDGTLHAPAEFLPVAERYNIIHEIDRWVFEYVLKWIAEHQAKYQLPKLLVNLSGMSFVDNKFVEHLVKTLNETEADIDKIAFEITETAAVDNLETAALFMQQIKSMGCKFALDDFGTGFSTFAYLKKLPIDYLKIDGSLVRNMTMDPVDREMVRAINEIGHTVGALTIAEYVEDAPTLDMLREMRVNYAQGYALQRPGPIAQLLQHIDKNKVDVPFSRAS